MDPDLSIALKVVRRQSHLLLFANPLELEVLLCSVQPDGRVVILVKNWELDADMSSWTMLQWCFSVHDISIYSWWWGCSLPCSQVEKISEFSYHSLKSVAECGYLLLKTLKSMVSRHN